MRSGVLLLVVYLQFATAQVSSAQVSDAQQSSSIPLGHSVELSFVGPASSEKADVNPFTDYRLTVVFTHPQSHRVIRGFYAADGQAAETGATSGRVWQVRFSPDREGEWSYQATLRKGSMIAIDDRDDEGESVRLEAATGSFSVSARKSDTRGLDFRGRGRLIADGGYFRFAGQESYWIKGGANSPENLLAYDEFDETYRRQAKARDGEAAPPGDLHRYQPHVRDWTPDDPTWGDGRGKGLIGAINYLASAGMNASYFLTLNIGGDGNDVWPYCSPNDFTRFDCSKLDQWEIVFAHMQQCGVLMHVVTQETENEKLLDQGDVGPNRKLYYLELIARFAHHNALVWNLGEENGPADFSPDGQNDQQQRAMADFLRKNDPYQHPIQIHTHANAKVKEEQMPALLGHLSLDGLSMQINPKETVHDQILRWRRASEESGQRWLITMDEIGRWDTGAVTDGEDTSRDQLRRHVLWGSLMAGAAGVEWYFGAKHPHNDLNSEDWRQRAELWRQTRVALDFFERHLPYWKLESMDSLTSDQQDFVAVLPGQIYVLYLPADSEEFNSPKLDLTAATGQFSVHWYNCLAGGDLQSGTKSTVDGGQVVELGNPPSTDDRESKFGKDWVVLLRRKH